MSRIKVGVKERRSSNRRAKRNRSNKKHREKDNEEMTFPETTRRWEDEEIELMLSECRL